MISVQLCFAPEACRCPVTLLSMSAFLELAQACHCCSRLPGPSRPRTPWGGLTRQQVCSSTAKHCQAPHRSNARGKCPVVARASTSISQDVSSAADPQPRSEPSRYEGLSWVNQQGMGSEELAAEYEALSMRELPFVAEVALRQADEPPVQPAPRVVDESHPRRHPYHRELLAALSRNSVEDVEDILQTMQEDNLEPGPLAYNTLVLAHIKAGDLDAAFDVLQDLQHQGLQPVPQTFCALIHSFVRSGQLWRAEEVLHAMEDSQTSAYPGWLVFTKQLWAKGHLDLAQLYLKERPAAWKVDGDLYEHVIRHICTDASDNASYLLDPDFQHIAQQMKPSLAEAMEQDAPAHFDDIQAEEADEAAQSPLQKTLDNIWRVMQESNVAVEVRHCNPVLELAATTGNFRSARFTLDKMTKGSLAAPNAASYECLAEAYVVSKKGRLEEDMSFLTMEMTKLGLQPTKRMYSLSMEAALQANNLEMALAKLKGMREAGLGIMQRLSDSVLADLLWKLSSNNQPADLLRTLKTMQRDDKYLARGPHNQHDQQGRSFLTAWLAAKPRASVQGFQGLPNQSALHVIQEVDGYKVLNNKWILSKDDKILPTSNLTVPQLRVELKVRQLLTDGKREELMKRVRAARNSDPPDIGLDVWKRQEAKNIKQKKSADREEAKRKAQETGVSSGPSGKTEVVFKAWGQGGVKDQTKKEVKVDEDAEEGVVVDEADEGDADMTMDDPMQSASAATSEETYGGKAEDGFDDDDDGNTDEARAVAVSAAAAPSQQVFTNQNAGLDAAMQLLRLTQSLNGAATAADYQTLLEAAEQEDDANVAWSLVRSWHQTLQEAYDAETVERYYNRALKICKQATNSALALEVQRKMQQYGITETLVAAATETA